MNKREKAPRVLVVDDEIAMAESVADGLAGRGFDAVAIGSGTRAAKILESEAFDALVTDLRMAGVDGLELLALSRRIDPERPVILMTAFGAIDSAVEAIRRGAHHYLAKPFKLDELVIFLERALDDVRLRREATVMRKALRAHNAAPAMLGRSKAMRTVFEVIDRVADTAVPVLITGETGTGKGMVAAALHARSSRAGAPFVAVNCAALPEALLESELFGHVKGAFTGATAVRTGLFVDADGGTLLLDEIGEIPVALQAKLLHALERNAVRPVGASREREIDVRVVAATNRDLRGAVAEGTFREDLLYRLDVVTFELPPLRNRAEDIPELVGHLVASARARHPHAVADRVSPEVMARLLDHRWPGNVRELAHALERMVLLARGPEITLADMPPTLLTEPSRARSAFHGDVQPLREIQRAYAVWALDQCGGVRSRAAGKLGVDVKTLAKLLTADADRTNE